MSWPAADLDVIGRLSVLAAVVPGAVVAETRIDAPFEQVWAVAADLEHELPHYLRDVRSMRIATHSGERLEGYARGYAGLRARFDIVLRPGWCVMRSRFLLGGLAAVADGEHTRAARSRQPHGTSPAASGAVICDAIRRGGLATTTVDPATRCG